MYNHAFARQSLFLRGLDCSEHNFELFHANESSTWPDTKSEEVGDEPFVVGTKSFFFCHSSECIDDASIGVWATHESSLDYISRASNYCSNETSHKTCGEMKLNAFLHWCVLEKHLLELIVAGHFSNINTYVSYNVRLDSSVESKEPFISINVSINSIWWWHLSTWSYFSCKGLHSDLDNVLLRELDFELYLPLGLQRR